nr:LysM peptidoglycan-binding domain-containing protein [Paenibacillus dendrobii]
MQIGQKVKIPAEPVQVPSNDQIIHKHVVKQGDSLWKLSKAWGVSLKEMIDANPQLKNPNALLVGEVVNIPKTSGNSNANENANANANAHHDKVLPGGKAFTGPKEEITAPKAEATAPINVQPQQLEMPNHPLPNVMPNANVMPEITVPNVMPNLPNIMPEMIKPNVMPNVMPEMIMPNVMPNVMPEMIKPNEKPNVMPEMTMPNIMPNVMPNIMPLSENKPMHVMPVAEEPCGCDDNYFMGGAHHPFMHYPTPVQEVGSFHDMYCDDHVQSAHTYNNMPYPGNSHYPGIVEGAEDADCMPNQSWVSPYSQMPDAGQWGENHWENHQSPVAYEPNMQSPVSYQPNQPYHHANVSPMYYEPVHAQHLPYNPCGCSDVSPAYHSPQPTYVEPMYHHPGAFPQFMHPDWCYPYPAPMVGHYGAGPNSQLGAYSHDPNMPYHDPNMPFPGWGGMGHPEWDRAQAYAYPPQSAQPDGAMNTASVKSAEVQSNSLETADRVEEPQQEPAKKVKTMSSSKNNTKAASEKVGSKKPHKQVVSSKRKNPWIKG